MPPLSEAPDRPIVGTGRRSGFEDSSSRRTEHNVAKVTRRPSRKTEKATELS